MLVKNFFWYSQGCNLSYPEIWICKVLLRFSCILTLFSHQVFIIFPLKFYSEPIVFSVFTYTSLHSSITVLLYSSILLSMSPFSTTVLWLTSLHHCCQINLSQGQFLLHHLTFWCLSMASCDLEYQMHVLNSDIKVPHYLYHITYVTFIFMTLLCGPYILDWKDSLVFPTYHTFFLFVIVPFSSFLLWDFFKTFSHIYISQVYMYSFF